MGNKIEIWRNAPAELSIPEDRIDVWRVRLDVPMTDGQGPEILSRDEADRAARFRFSNDRKKFVNCRIALRVLLGRYLEVAPEDILFCYGEKGKPQVVISMNSCDLSFNVSNSGDLGLIAVTAGRAIGVDIERIVPEVDWVEIATRFFSDREVRALLALPEDERLRGFFGCWTRKEALLKGKGQGLTYPILQFSVPLGDEGPAEVRELKNGLATGSGWWLADVCPGQGYMATVAVEGAPFRIGRWYSSLH